jgi:hypothetical protein
MPITLETPVVLETPIVFEKLHLDELTITLERTQAAKVSLLMRVTPYTIINGQKVFAESKTLTTSVPDAEQLAATLAAGGDMRGVQAIQQVEELVALLVEATTNLGEASTG